MNFVMEELSAGNREKTSATSAGGSDIQTDKPYSAVAFGESIVNAFGGSLPPLFIPIYREHLHTQSGKMGGQCFAYAFGRPGNDDSFGLSYGVSAPFVQNLFKGFQIVGC